MQNLVNVQPSITKMYEYQLPHSYNLFSDTFQLLSYKRGHLQGHKMDQDPAALPDQRESRSLQQCQHTEGREGPKTVKKTQRGAAAEQQEAAETERE